MVIDNREEFAQAELLPWASQVIYQEYLPYLQKFKPNSGDAVIIITHGHLYDEEILDDIGDIEETGTNQY